MGSQPKAEAARRFIDRWYGKVALLLLSVMLYTLALAPVKQFYLAWVGLVPWLWVVSESSSQWRAFLWSWLAGTIFYLANMWWLAYVTGPGMIALLVYLGLYWAVPAIILRGAGWLKPSGDPGNPKRYVWIVLGISTVLAATECARGYVITGLPWLYLGHTQSPVLVVCQIADLFGVWGISFFVAAVNALLFLYLRVENRRELRMATTVVIGMWGASIAYGAFRIATTPSASHAGPRVLVVQPNYPQNNKGEKGASESERLKFHVEATESAIRKYGNVDLACWSETMMPGVNDEYVELAKGAANKEEGVEDYGGFLKSITARIAALAHNYHTCVLTGGMYLARYDFKHHAFADRRNAAYIFRPDGFAAGERYDKIHLVPFGEFLPFKQTPGLIWLHDFFMWFSPYDFDYTLTPGPSEAPTVFAIHAVRSNEAVRVVTPICFEDIDSALCAKMLRGNGGKRADVLVNLTNDGWFRGGENAQHLQAAIFRSIENRVPMARCVNTGISAFIDSTGRVTEKMDAGTEGTAIATLSLDSRYTLYTRFGDWFAGLCVLVTGGIVIRQLMVHYRTRRGGTA